MLLHANHRNIPGGNSGLITQKIIANELLAVNDRSALKSITTGIDGLIKREIMSVHDRFHYLVDYKKLCCEDEFFTIIYSNEIYKIMNYDSHDKKSGLLRYMCSLFSTFNNKYNIGFMPQSYISDCLNKSIATIEKYNTILVNLEIIGILKPSGYINRNGKADKLTNIYYRPKDYSRAVNYIKNNGLIQE